MPGYYYKRISNKGSHYRATKRHNNMIVNYKVLHPNLAPKRAVDSDVGYDIRSAIEKVLNPKQTQKIPTGLYLELPRNTFGMVCSKSGLVLNYGIVVPNSPGIIDSGYRGQIQVILKNTSDTQYLISHHTKVAQLIILTYCDIKMTPLSQLGDTARGSKGFGSTGLE